MLEKPGAERGMTDRPAGRGLLYGVLRRALGRSIVALVIACGDIKIGRLEAAGTVRKRRGFFRTRPGLWLRRAAAGTKFLLGKSVSPR